ncbi:MAG: sensor domain-containing diguanylate cyclase [Vicinamibacteria bacterium]|jgi:diguanylate cyclase (GGDEF)-like protein|nr:sensor domain-containing diguanylate cyclase [Vicinamibacteria bacterium]
MELPAATVVVPAITGIAGLVIGRMIAGVRSAQEQAERERWIREQERTESDRAFSRVHKEMRTLSEKAREQSLVFVFLPDIIRQIFSASGLRTIGPLALDLVEKLFHPEQAAIFVSRPSQKKLVLAVGSGLPNTLKPGFIVNAGEGRIGTVASLRVAMDDKDFHGPLNAPGPGTHAANSLGSSGVPGLKSDIVVPIMDEQQVLGAISLAGARTRLGQEKRLLTMVADITAVALTHAARLRASADSEFLDGLTGVFNKQYLLKRLDEEVAVAERDHTPLSLLIIDLDNFRQYNRSNGGGQGDTVLKQLAQILKNAIRQTDIVGRFGGEEFVILYPGATKERAMRLAEAIRQAVEDYPFANRGQQPLGAVTVSGGVATFPEDSEKAEHLLRAADHALYEAKAEGRNRIVPAEPNFIA